MNQSDENVIENYYNNVDLEKYLKDKKKTITGLDLKNKVKPEKEIDENYLNQIM